MAPTKTGKQMLKESQAEIRQSIREIERAQKDLMKKEEKRQLEVKAMAAKGQLQTVRIMAKDLVRMRASISKFYSMKAELESVSFNLSQMQSTAAMADAMKNATRAIMRMNATQPLPALQKVLQRYVKEQDMMNMKQEVMNDTMDQVMEGDEGDEDEVVNKVLDELGIKMAEELESVPTGIPGGLPVGLTNRLENLKK